MTVKCPLQLITPLQAPINLHENSSQKMKEPTGTWREAATNAVIWKLITKYHVTVMSFWFLIACIIICHVFPFIVYFYRSQNIFSFYF